MRCFEVLHAVIQQNMVPANHRTLDAHNRPLFIALQMGESPSSQHILLLSKHLR